MNKLKKYMAEYRGNPTVLASKLGVSTVTLYNWIGGKTKPRVDTAIHLEKITKGKVDIYCWK